MKKRKVLIPLDDSEFSRAILPHVLGFCSPDDSELILLRVTHEPTGLVPLPPRAVEVLGVSAYESRRDVELSHHPIYASQVAQNVEAEATAAMHEDVALLREAGFEVTTAVRFGDPAPEIVAFAKSEGVDMIAMATHRRNVLSRLVLGSVAEQVVRQVKVPVLLIRPFDL